MRAGPRWTRPASSPGALRGGSDDCAALSLRGVDLDEVAGVQVVSAARSPRRRTVTSPAWMRARAPSSAREASLTNWPSLISRARDRRCAHGETFAGGERITREGVDEQYPWVETQCGRGAVSAHKRRYRRGVPGCIVGIDARRGRFSVVPRSGRQFPDEPWVPGGRLSAALVLAPFRRRCTCCLALTARESIARLPAVDRRVAARGDDADGRGGARLAHRPASDA